MNTLNPCPGRPTTNRPALPLGSVRDPLPDRERVLAGLLEAAAGASPTAPAPPPGSPQEPRDPETQALLRVLAYSYATGVFASSEIEEALNADPILRYLAGDRHPESGTLRRFRRRHRQALQRCLAQTLERSWGDAKTGEPHLPLADARPQGSLANHLEQPYRPDFELEAADRVRRAIRDDTALLDE